jgi:hypothetical protein
MWSAVQQFDDITKVGTGNELAQVL